MVTWDKLRVYSHVLALKRVYTQMSISVFTIYLNLRGSRVAISHTPKGVIHLHTSINGAMRYAWEDSGINSWKLRIPYPQEL